jgi:hypothetical protein
MKRKLTLRMSDEAIERAKEYAAERGISVSRLVENFFEVLETGDAPDVETSPLVESLLGTLEDADLDEEDHREHLEDKHL